MKKITAEWKGQPYCLCSGEWTITIDGKKIELPDDVRTNNMNTYGTYDRWFFDEDWDEVWESYTDGLTFKPWLKENTWVNNLGLNDAEKEVLFNAISAEDWRHGSCGGCI